MSGLLNERVPSVAPRGTHVIVGQAEAFLEAVSPDALVEPGQLDLLKILDKLEAYGIFMNPAYGDELGDDEGMTYWNREGGTTEIVIREAFYDALVHGGSDRNRARTTVGHELGHAALHRRVLKRLALDPVPLSRHQRRRDIKAYRDPEWQAWTFCGAILLPRMVMRRLSGQWIEDVAATQGVSTLMVRRHLDRMGRFGFNEARGRLVAT